MRVSILIPVYNQESLIERCINSIPKRDDIEIIVVDDCSTDNTLKVLEKFDNIKIIKNETNLGIGSTRNKLLDNASGDYIFFLDSDDYLYTEEFNKVMDTKLNNQICLKTRHRRNDGYVWYPRVHRGDFVRRSFIGDTRHPNKRCGEDSDFKKLIKDKEGYAEERIPNVIYHYNEPRIDSLTWEYRKANGFKGYDKGVDEWEEVYGK